MKVKLVSLFLYLTLYLHSEVKVTSFLQLPFDSLYTQIAKYKDSFSANYAIIRVPVGLTGFTWQTDSSFIDVINESKGETWLLIHQGAKSLQVSHSSKGQFINYKFPTEIKANGYYWLEIKVSGDFLLSTKAEAHQKLIIQSNPSAAEVYVDEKIVGKTPLNSDFVIGKHSWKVSAPYFDSESGEVELTYTKGKVIKLNLRPNAATILVSTSPEKGAVVKLDGKIVSRITPCTISPVTVGNHVVSVQKTGYETDSKKVNLVSSETLPLHFELHPTFADIRLISEPNGAIYMDGEQISVNSWRGRLKPGTYTFAARRDTTWDKATLTLRAGQKVNLTLRPTTAKGNLVIKSNPDLAIVHFDERNICQTPVMFKGLRAGKYLVELSVLGYAPYVDTVLVCQGKTTTIDAKLYNGKIISINSLPSDAQLYIDGMPRGKTPFRDRLLYGKHVVKVLKDGADSQQMIQVSHSSSDPNKFLFNIDYSFAAFRDTVGEVVIDMLALKGGNFDMGDVEGEFIEKPVHSVTVNNFYMATTEVTQQLWEAVMGDNPSVFVGKNLPVENITWDQAQTFIKRLNKITHKHYRLPTEAEWEYAASASGDDDKLNVWAGTSDELDLMDYAWYDINSKRTTHPVATKKPNSRGLYDMSGNVSEWCSDWYVNYTDNLDVNRQGPNSGFYKVSRGGSWYRSAKNCRVSFRDLNSPKSKADNIGLRLVMSPN